MVRVSIPHIGTYEEDLCMGQALRHLSLSWGSGSGIYGFQGLGFGAWDLCHRSWDVGFSAPEAYV